MTLVLFFYEDLFQLFGLKDAKKEKRSGATQKILTGEIGSGVRSMDHQNQKETEENPEVIHGTVIAQSFGSAVLTAGRTVRGGQ